MGTKTWIAEIEGNEIVVTNYFSLLKWKACESLEVNGKLIQRREGSIFRTSSYLSSTITTTSGKRTLGVLIGQSGFGIGCHIFLDNVLTAGDTDTNLNIPTIEEWKEIEAVGLSNFILRRGVATMGLPYAVLMTLFGSGDLEISGKVAMFIFYLLFFGVSMGYLQWWSLSKQYSKQEL